MDQQEALKHCISTTNVSNVPGGPYRGKVRDVYTLNEETLGIVVTDRISAFDHIMKQPVPFKGQILNKLSEFSFKQVEDIVSHHILEVPHPNVTIAKKCVPVPIEVVIRGYLTGHAWREYSSGKRTLCGVALPSGMKEHQKFPAPVLTPATKAEEGHDEDISEKEILEQKIIKPDLWEEIRDTAFRLFQKGTEIAARQGLILVDTKYEFGYFNGELTLIDEVHTSDSSRYFYSEGYEERLKNNKPQRQLSKEFLREWLMEQGFRGLKGQTLPDLTDTFRWSIYQRYAELYETLTGKRLEPVVVKNFEQELSDIFEPYL